MDTSKGCSAEVKLITSDEEALFYLEQDTITFPSNHLEIQQGMSWWKKYPEAAYSISVNGKPIGYLSFWPLEKEIFIALRDGKISENDINEYNISPPNICNLEEWWYIGGIFVLEEYRKLSYTKELIESSIRQWLNGRDKERIINICALAYSKEGASLLKKYAFKISNKKNEIEVYYRAINKRLSLKSLASIKSCKDIIISNEFHTKIIEMTIMTSDLIRHLLTGEQLNTIYSYIGLNKKEIEICNLFSGTPPLFCVRPDFIISELGEPKICEINARFPLNGIFAGQLSKSTLDMVSGKEILDIFYNTFKYLDNNITTHIISCDEKSIELDYIFEFSEVTDRLKMVHHKDITIDGHELKFEGETIKQSILNLSAKDINLINKDFFMALSKIKTYNDPRMALIIHSRYILSLLFETQNVKLKNHKKNFVNTYKEYNKPSLSCGRVLFKENDTGKGLGVRQVHRGDNYTNGVYQPFIERKKENEKNVKLPSEINLNFIVGSFFVTQLGNEDIIFFRSSKHEIVNIENKASLIHQVRTAK